jgi:signal recognition particle subunit SRP68
VRRLRKTLHLSCGNTKKFQKKEITPDDLTTDNKVLMIPLFLAERAWAFAMQLKQESNSEPRKKFHLINRLRKAIRFAADLEKLSQSSKCDARTKLEAQGYSSLINGQFYFETQKWKESLNFFNLAKYVLVFVFNQSQNLL